MSLGQICNRETIVIGKDESILEAAKLMREHHVGSVVVVESGVSGVRPIGIVTDRDLVVEILAAELDPATVSIGDIMSFDLVTGRENEMLWDALQRMRVRGVRRMPVVDQDGTLLGIITSDDLLEALTAELSQLVKLVGREREREARARGPLGA